MAGDEPIWYSSFLYNSRTYRDLGYDLADNDRQLRLERQDRHLKGESLIENDIPINTFCRKSSMGDKLPDVFFIANRLLFVSERFKNLLRDFQLGATQFFPVNVLERDQETLVKSGPFYLMNYTEFRDVAVPEQISNARKVGCRFSVTDLKAAPVVVRPERLDGLDFALDPVVFNLAFFSDRLIKAIKAAKIKPLSFVKCVAAEQCSKE